MRRHRGLGFGIIDVFRVNFKLDALLLVQMLKLCFLVPDELQWLILVTIFVYSSL